MKFLLNLPPLAKLALAGIAVAALSNISNRLRAYVKRNGAYTGEEKI